MVLRAGGAKAKGASGERELADLLAYWARDAGVAVQLTRNLEQTRGGGHDLCGLEDYGLAVEVKRVEALAVAQWWKQACRQADAAKCAPVLAYRQNRKAWTFMVRVWVYPSAGPLDVTMDANTFRAWYVAHLKSFDP